MKNTFFVTGTDTGVGKTLVTAALLHKAKQQNKKAYGLKPISAGCVDTGSGLQNEDALQIMQENGVELSYAQVNPIALKAAKAPHIAAAEEGKRLDLNRLEGMIRGALMTPAELRLIEGAGGWRIPLSPSQQLAHLPVTLDVPIILVVGMRLGCLNHALLTAEAIHRDGLSLAGWVANSPAEPMDSLAENINTLQHCIAAPLLGQIPYLNKSSAGEAAAYINLP